MFVKENPDRKKNSKDTQNGITFIIDQVKRFERFEQFNLENHGPVHSKEIKICLHLKKFVLCVFTMSHTRLE